MALYGFYLVRMLKFRNFKFDKFREFAENFRQEKNTANWTVAIWITTQKGYFNTHAEVFCMRHNRVTTNLPTQDN